MNMDLKVVRYIIKFVLRTPVFWVAGYQWIVEDESHLVVIIALLLGTGAYSIFDFIWHNLRRKQAVNSRNALEVLKAAYNVDHKKFEDYIDPAKHDMFTSDQLNVSIKQLSKKDPNMKHRDHYEAYCQPGGSPWVFVEEKPEEMARNSMFNLLHEVGHCIFSGYQHNLEVHFPVLRLLVLYIPVMLFYYSDLFPFILLCSALTIHLCTEIKTNNVEIAADQFAAYKLSQIYGKDTASKTITKHMNHLEKLLEKSESSQSAREYRSRLFGFDQYYHKDRDFILNENMDSLQADLTNKVNKWPLLIIIAVIILFPAQIPGNFLSGFAVLLWIITTVITYIMIEKADKAMAERKLAESSAMLDSIL